MPKRTSPKNKKQKKSSSVDKSSLNKQTSVESSAVQKVDRKNPRTNVVSDVGAESKNSSKSTISADATTQSKFVEPPVSRKGTSNGKNNLGSLWSNEKTRNQILAVGFGALFIALTIATAFVWIPSIIKDTDDYKAIEERDKKAKEDAEKAEKDAQAAAERAKLVETENSVLSFDNQTVAIDTSFGTLNIDLKYDTAPATVENFVRLVYRGFYNDQKIHRIVEADGFNVIQGGRAGQDETAQAANGSTVVDELWTVKPEFEQGSDQSLTLKNDPVLKEPALAKDFNPQQGTIVYPKGLILMAKTSQPNSATTQFFITLTDTVLPAEYTAFGVVEPGSMDVLDKILNEVDPQQTEQTTEGYKDGEPDKDITYSIKLTSLKSDDNK